ncbi:unnamed protein product [Clonostachys chloroleuca]|uniref:CBM1 domain-containing protein n=1 Tax=Clonostachys chloroleuca TaxID=1926264 RepID=A0AA35QB23_9HYPO|nr:unnamed protein product [Clonostachys chloroleuca]
MRGFALSAALLSGFLTCSSALSDLDASVWKNIESKVDSRSIKRLSNRPVKRQSGWSPPSELSTALTEVWSHYESTYSGGPFAETNWGWHQIMKNKGSLSICVRWDSTASVTEAQRTQTASKYAEQYEKWFKWLYGFDGFPYSAIDVKIVGWAVKDKSLLQGSTDGITVYTDLDSDGVPMCTEGQFDHSLWLTDGLEGGFGYTWGQQVGREYFMNNIDSENIHILLHEMGHTFGLDDYWTPTGVTNFIMLAGSAMEVTDFDGWMFRNWWYELAQKNSWSSGSSDSTGAPSSASSAVATTPAATAPAATAPATTAAPYPTTTPGGSPASTVRTRTRTRTRTSSGAVETPTQATSVVAAPSQGGFQGGMAAKKWGQCGGIGHSGTTECDEGLECVQQNEYYFQCL